eukprot:6463396-Prymnesium_polylepis.1
MFIVHSSSLPPDSSRNVRRSSCEQQAARRERPPRSVCETGPAGGAPNGARVNGGRAAGILAARRAGGGGGSGGGGGGSPCAHTWRWRPDRRWTRTGMRSRRASCRATAPAAPQGGSAGTWGCAAATAAGRAYG